MADNGGSDLIRLASDFLAGSGNPTSAMYTAYSSFWETMRKRYAVSPLRVFVDVVDFFSGGGGVFGGLMLLVACLLRLRPGGGLLLLLLMMMMICFPLDWHICHL